MTRISISSNTEELLARRPDDYRMLVISDILFSNDIGGAIPDRKFEIADGKTGNISTEILRKAKTGDVLDYELVRDPEIMRQSIEMNIANLQKLRSLNNSAMPVSKIWIVTVESDIKGNLSTNVFLNPSAADCSTIIKGDNEVVACAFAVCYPQPSMDKSQTSADDDCIDWIMLTPGDSSKLSEYDDIIKRIEAKNLESMFWLDFTKDNSKKGE